MDDIPGSQRWTAVFCTPYLEELYKAQFMKETIGSQTNAALPNGCMSTSSRGSDLFDLPSAEIVFVARERI